jgi:hypothetical protein
VFEAGTCRGHQSRAGSELKANSGGSVFHVLGEWRHEAADLLCIVGCRQLVKVVEARTWFS